MRSCHINYGIKYAYRFLLKSLLLNNTKNIQNKSILLAEGFIPARNIMSEILQMLGYNYKTVSNGIELILELKNKKVDLILLDIEFAQYDGFETIEHIRRNLNYPINGVPVIAMINKDFSSNFKETFEEEGFDDIIIKPFSLNELEGKIKKVLLRPLNRYNKISN